MTELFLVGVGGALGAVLRYELGQMWPTPAGGFPVATFVINLSGCLLIGVFLAVLLERWPQATRIRLFFGVGVLGGYTTFSTYAVEVVRLGTAGHPVLGAGYLLATLFGAVAATLFGAWLGRSAARLTGGAQ